MRAFYGRTRNEIHYGTISPINSDIKLLLVSAEYGFNPDHQTPIDVASSSIIATSEILTNKSTMDGGWLSDPVTFSAVTGTIDAVGIIGYLETGTEETNFLLWFQDEGIIGMPFTPNGQNVTLTWSDLGIWRMP